MFTKSDAMSLLLAFSALFALPLVCAEDKTNTTKILTSSVIIDFGENTKYQNDLNASAPIINGTKVSPDIPTWFITSTGHYIGEEKGFFFYSYDNETLTQNLSCTVKTLRASENYALYNLTSAVPFKPVSNNTDVASLRCVPNPLEVYNSNSSTIQ